MEESASMDGEVGLANSVWYRECRERRTGEGEGPWPSFDSGDVTTLSSDLSGGDFERDSCRSSLFILPPSSLLR